MPVLYICKLNKNPVKSKQAILPAKSNPGFFGIQELFFFWHSRASNKLQSAQFNLTKLGKFRNHLRY